MTGWVCFDHFPAAAMGTGGDEGGGAVCEVYIFLRVKVHLEQINILRTFADIRE